jgi:hypothetical protein
VTSTSGTRLYRLALHLYPPSFRAGYEDALLQAALDRHTVEGVALWRVLSSEIVNVGLTAPRMRLESPMTRTIAAIALATVGAVGALVGGPAVLLVVAALATALWFAVYRHDRPVAPSGRSSRPFAVAGAVALALAVAIPAVDGGELDQLWWSVMAACALAGIVLLATSLVLAVGRPSHT